MRIYLDEDCAQALLAKFLRQADHDVLMPADAGMLAKSDPVRDMTLRGIVRAVDKVAAALPDLRDLFQVLNQWR